ncbi:serine/threonine protein phosphatase 1 [Novimethylophilus kurashikiensis]|uniref:Serine/threonine protein phosphatase 1 n=1 Tax=Novimethylophilus kurashikiensis TaxID=1825523 RepID=A0A2R5FB84_9PROT|nr:metallophosphoesterase [Novimethylophilus kurashikiensis]GBG14808.1 serine/threonine protein phosphatase 1 [Novimethylophilus kurashikiensis]
MLVRKFERNSQGRDFVVGDIHGAFDLLVNALNLVEFNPDVDRLFLVGDLVDRGRYSKVAKDFLSQPWVHSTRGNHEQLFLSLFANGKPSANELAWHVERNGLGWVTELTQDEIAEFCRLFSALPFAIEVETVRGSVGLVHAEVPVGMDWATFLRRISEGDEQVIQSAIWGRTRAKQEIVSGVLGVDRLFAGHTPQAQGAKRFGNCYIVDTAAVFGSAHGPTEGHLSLANMTCTTEVLVSPASQKSLVEIFNIPSNRPFGYYASN